MTTTLRRIETCQDLHCKNRVYHDTAWMSSRSHARNACREAANYKEEPPEDIDCSLYVDADAHDADDCIAGLHDHSAEAEFLEMYKKH